MTLIKPKPMTCTGLWVKSISVLAQRNPRLKLIYMNDDEALEFFEWYEAWQRKRARHWDGIPRRCSTVTPLDADTKTGLRYEDEIFQNTRLRWLASLQRIAIWNELGENGAFLMWEMVKFVMIGLGRESEHWRIINWYLTGDKFVTHLRE